MSWLKLPKGNDDQMNLVWKVLGVIVLLFIVWDLHGFLERKLEGRTTEETLKNVEGWFDGSGDWFPLLGTLLLELLIFVLFLALIVLAGFYVYHLVYRRSAEQNAKYLRIIPRTDVVLDPDKIMSFVKSFGSMKRHIKETGQYGPLWFRLRYAILPDSSEIGIYLAFPADKEKEVYEAIKSAYPKAELISITAEQYPTPDESGGRGGFFSNFSGLPLTSVGESKRSDLGTILASLRPGSYIDVHFSPVSWKLLNKRFDKAGKGLKNKKIQEMEPEEKARKVSLTKRSTEKSLAFKVRVCLWSNHKKETDQVVDSIANRIIAALKDVGSLRFHRRKLKIFNFMLDRNLIPFPIPFTFMIWGHDELSTLFHIPPGDHIVYQEPTSGSRGYLAHLLPYEPHVYQEPTEDGIKIGTLVHPRDHGKPVKLTYDQLCNHFLLTGSKGMGRVSASVEMIQSMIDEWVKNPDKAPGFTIIDPGREIIPIVTNRLRKLEQEGVSLPKEKIHHYDLSDDTTHLVGLNMLHKVKNMPVNEAAERIARILMYDFPLSNPDTVPLQRILSLAVHALLLDDEPHTLLEVEYMLTNEPFRKRILRRMKDPYLRHYWAQVGGGDWHKKVQPILDLIEPLLQDPTTRRIYLQKEMALDISKFMDDGHLVMIDLNEMKRHELNITVGYLVYLYHQYGKQRSADAKFHLVMVDEFQRVQLPTFTVILNEEERYQHCIGMVTREIDHLPKEGDLSRAIRNNIGVILSCAQEEGADEVETLSRGRIRVQDVEPLPERTMMVYIRGKAKQRAQAITYKVNCQAPAVYDVDGQEVDYTNKTELEKAHQLGIEWGREIMRISPEARSLDELDMEIFDYMEDTANIS